MPSGVCKLGGCVAPSLAFGFCDPHLRERMPAAWAKHHQIHGKTEPRLATEPMRKLTPRSTLGYQCAEFAEQMLGMDLMPWQRWWMLHALETDDAGQFRYRTVITLVARQNGKTTLMKAVALWMMYVGRARLTLGSAQSLDIARECWADAVDLAQGNAELAAEVESVRYANGEQCLTLASGARYRIAAATRSAGRGLSVDLLLLDELREHRSWDAWGALAKTTMARPCALTLGFSNAGDAESVVLNKLRSDAQAGADPTVGLFEWSAPEGADLDDRDGWAAANPALGYRITETAIASARTTDPPATFRTEVLCQKVDHLDGAVDLLAWKDGTDVSSTLDGHRDRVAVGIDASPDGQHVSLIAAVAVDGRVRLEVVKAWPNTDDCRRDLPELLGRVQPKALGWLPAGPMVALRPVIAASVPKDCEVRELRGTDVQAACMGLAELVAARRVQHPGDPLLDDHLAGASKTYSGDGWRFARIGGAGHVDAAYAAAAASLVAQELPTIKARPKALIV